MKLQPNRHTTAFPLVNFFRVTGKGETDTEKEGKGKKGKGEEKEEEEMIPQGDGNFCNRNSSIV